MTRLLLLIALVAGCCKQSQPPEKVKATIVGVFAPLNGEAYETRTYLKDEHGHYDYVTGLWGKIDDTVSVECRRGYLHIKR